MSFLRQMTVVFPARGKFLPLPIIIKKMVPGRFLVPTEGSAIAPFIYALA